MFEWPNDDLDTKSWRMSFEWKPGGTKSTFFRDTRYPNTKVKKIIGHALQFTVPFIICARLMSNINSPFSLVMLQPLQNPVIKVSYFIMSFPNDHATTAAAITPAMTRATNDTPMEDAALFPVAADPAAVIVPVTPAILAPSVSDTAA